MMHESFAHHALADAAFAQQIDRALFEHARAQRRLDFASAARLQNDGRNAGAVQQMRQQKSCRPRADDADLRAVHSSAQTKFAALVTSPVPMYLAKAG